MERRTMGRKIYFEMFGGRFLLRASIPSLRRSFSKRSRSKITRLYMYIFSLPSRIFFSKIALLFEEEENRAFRTFATTIGKNSCTLQIWPRSRRNSGCLGRRKLSIDPPFESVDSHACVSQCSFHPRDDCLSASLRLLV